MFKPSIEDFKKANMIIMNPSKNTINNKKFNTETRNNLI